VLRSLRYNLRTELSLCDKWAGREPIVQNNISKLIPFGCTIKYIHSNLSNSWPVVGNGQFKIFQFQITNNIAVGIDFSNYNMLGNF
jgi:hypothetical protein